VIDQPGDRSPGTAPANIRAELSDQAQGYQAGHDQYIVNLHSLGGPKTWNLAGLLSRAAAISPRREWAFLAAAGAGCGTLVMLFMPWISVSVSGTTVSGGVFSEGLMSAFAIVAILAAIGTLIATGAYFGLGRQALAYLVVGLSGMTALFVLIEVLYVNGEAATANTMIRSMNNGPVKGHGAAPGAHFLAGGWIDLLLAGAAFGLAIAGLARRRRAMAAAGRTVPGQPSPAAAPR
jgi:hypothetical protein